MSTGSGTGASLDLGHDRHRGGEGDERRVGGLWVEGDGAVDGSEGRCVVVGDAWGGLG